VALHHETGRDNLQRVRDDSGEASRQRANEKRGAERQLLLLLLLLIVIIIIITCAQTTAMREPLAVALQLLLQELVAGFCR
jgi:hypothetical protein